MRFLILIFKKAQTGKGKKNENGILQQPKRSRHLPRKKAKWPHRHEPEDTRGLTRLSVSHRTWLVPSVPVCLIIVATVPVPVLALFPLSRKKKACRNVSFSPGHCTPVSIRLLLLLYSTTLVTLQNCVLSVCVFFSHQLTVN